MKKSDSLPRTQATFKEDWQKLKLNDPRRQKSAKAQLLAVIIFGSTVILPQQQTTLIISLV